VPTRPRAGLRAFLEHPRRPDGTLLYHELQGFLFAVLSAPEVVLPGEWMPAIFNDGEAGYQNLGEARRILRELMVLYNAVNAAITEEQVSLPDDCRFREDILSNLDHDAPIAQWSRGFMTGYEWLEDTWEPYLTGDLSEEFGTMLLVLSFFSSRNIAEAYRVELGIASLEEMATTMREMFPAMMYDHATLGRAIHRGVMEQGKQEPTRATTKTGRNAPCPCGSGRKFKKCCGASVH
jgi:uncharacterized protein